MQKQNMQCLNFGDSPCHLLFEVNGCIIDFQHLQLNIIIDHQVKVQGSKLIAPKLALHNGI
jgi:hypothetical protein